MVEEGFSSCSECNPVYSVIYDKKKKKKKKAITQTSLDHFFQKDR